MTSLAALWMPNRRVALIILLAPVMGVGTCGGMEPANDQWQTLFANEDWYRSRPEAERTWEGSLQARNVVPGPNARTATRYSLLTGDEVLAVYAPGSPDPLERFVGRRVRMRGKAVDLTEEGYGMEVWPGSVVLVH